MSDGTFVTWNTTPVDLGLNDYVKPLWSQYYQVSRVHKAMFKKEHERIVSLWVLEHANDSKWVGPYLTQPKVKKNRVHLLIDFWNLNRQLKRKPYPMTKISDMLLKSEGFKSSTSLDLNIGYYHISLIEEASNLCTIILPWWKYWYKCLTMGVSNSLEIFHEKMNEMFRGFGFIWAYIDYLSMITNVDW